MSRYTEAVVKEIKEFIAGLDRDKAVISLSNGRLENHYVALSPGFAQILNARRYPATDEVIIMIPFELANLLSHPEMDKLKKLYSDASIYDDHFAEDKFKIIEDLKSTYSKALPKGKTCRIYGYSFGQYNTATVIGTVDKTDPNKMTDCIVYLSDSLSKLELEEVTDVSIIKYLNDILPPRHKATVLFESDRYGLIPLTNQLYFSNRKVFYFTDENKENPCIYLTSEKGNIGGDIYALANQHPGILKWKNIFNG